MTEEKEKKPLKKKRPTALKRKLQDKKKCLQNRVLKSKIHTARRAFVNLEGEAKEGGLNLLYSLIDKAVKKGIFKSNKGSRLKSRLSAK